MAKGRWAMFRWVQSLDSLLKRGNLRLLGLGLLLAWVYCTWFSNGIFEPFSSRSADTLRLSLVASAIGLIALAFRPNKRKPIGQAPIFWSAAIMSASTLLFFALPSGVALMVDAFVGGLASAILWVAWGEMFCRIGQDRAESCIPASLAVFVAAALMAYLLPWPAAGILSALCPIVSALMLLLSDNSQGSEFLFRAPQLPFLNVLPSLGKLALCSMACSLATGFVITSFSPQDLLIGGEGLILAYVLGGVAAGCIAAFAIAHTSRMSFSFLYEWAIPLIVFSLSLRVLGDPFCNTLATVLACTAALYVEVLFYALFARITAGGLCLPSETFGIFRSMVQLGFLAGGLLGSFASTSTPPLLPTGLALICVCVVILPLFIHLQKRFEVPTGQFIDSPDNREAADGTAAVSEPMSTAQTLDAIAAEYKLSAREREVLDYLGRGRSVPYMREVMVISKSTIETHIKHIYAKTDVHSKQELLDLIESKRTPR